MFIFFVQLVIFLGNVFCQAKREVYVDGTKGLKRHAGDGVAYANFAAHKFHYLNITPLLSVSVSEFRECGKLCVDHFSCFSFNGAAFRDMESRKMLCELLPSDKYNRSSKFTSSQIFHHFSIKVGKIIVNSDNKSYRYIMSLIIKRSITLSDILTVFSPFEIYE